MANSKKELPKETKKAADLTMVGTPEYYQNIVKQNPHSRYAYERLMVLYRQQKNYKKELQTINTAINVFEKMYAPSKSKGKKVNTISNQLNKLLGLVDKKGKNLFEHEHLTAWKKRKEIVVKKIKTP